MKNESEPLVSVIIPTYNRSHLINDAIDSILSQTYKNFELLVIDDQSTDNTEQLVKSFDDKRVEYLINKRKKGAQGARNTGIINAKGDFLAFLDSDDKWLNNKLEIQLGDMLQHNKQFSFTNRIVEKEDNKRFSTFIDPSCNIYKENYIGTFSSVMFSITLQKCVGLLDECLMSCQDWDYWIRVREFEKPYLIREPLIIFNHRDHKRITNNSKVSYQGHKKILEKYHDDIKRQGYLSNHYYKLALISDDWNYFKKAVLTRFNLMNSLRFIYYSLLR